MKIKYHKKFIKHFNQRIEPYSNLSKKFDERVQVFLNSPANPILQDHQLKGKKENFRSFSITGDIGTHNQVY